MIDLNLLAGLSTPTLVTGGIVAALVVLFAGAFLLPALLHLRRLSTIRRRIAALASPHEVQELREVFEGDRRLARLWAEYEDSLHLQREERGGQVVVRAVRATQPAEVLFNAQFLVDSRLRTEFFKHLPGIFTGAGIIGTFGGLIEGLKHFQVSENAATVRGSLETLMRSVGDAFVISASAIAVAMIVTFVEKLLLASLYRRTEDIAQAIDACFEAGAGEEYMERLVRSSEESVTQSRVLRDTLVKELGNLFRDRQDHTRQDHEALGLAIAESIRQSLQAPLENIAATVKAASADQGENALRLQQEVMGGFAQQLNELFGAQINGLAELNQKTARSVEDAVATLQDVVTSIESSGQRSADAVTQRMVDAVGRMQAREETLAQRADATVASMSGSIDTIVERFAATGTQLAETVSTLMRSTAASTDKMMAGADLLGTASRSFAAAGEGVSGALAQAAQLSTQLASSTGGLADGASALQAALGDYRAQRDAMAQLMKELQTTVEAARREASLTGEAMARIEGSAALLGSAQKQADTYLEGVSRVLGEAHGAFATEVKRTLDKANTEFHSRLSSAVTMLSAAIG